MKLEEAAKKALKLAKIRPEDRVLIVTDTPTHELGLALLAAAETEANASMLIIPEREHHSQEPQREVMELMQQANVIYAPLKHSITHTNAMRAALAKGSRAASMPGITPDALIRAMKADYKKVHATGEKIKKRLEAARTVYCEAEGTAIEFACVTRKVTNDDGDMSKTGTLVNLPAGEVMFPPLRGMSNGYFTAFLGNDARKGTQFIISNGFVEDITGDDTFKRLLFNTVNGRNIAELGIGTNPYVKLDSSVLENEKKLGTCHIAVGDSKSMGGEVTSDIHIDFVVDKPTIYFDDKLVMKNGRLRL